MPASWDHRYSGRTGEHADFFFRNYSTVQERTISAQCDGKISLWSGRISQSEEAGRWDDPLPGDRSGMAGQRNQRDFSREGSVFFGCRHYPGKRDRCTAGKVFAERISDRELYDRSTVQWIIIRKLPGLYRVGSCASESACCQTAFFRWGDFWDFGIPNRQSAAVGESAHASAGACIAGYL